MVDAAAFAAWLQQRGGYVHPSINLFHSTAGEHDRGVFATADIKQGEQLLLVPCDATLHLEVDDVTAKGAKLPATCRAELAAFLVAQQPPFSPFIATTLMLMAELAGGTDCPHAPYFATLPGPTDCLLNWSEEEQALLAGTSLAGACGRSTRSLYESQVAPRLAAAPALFPPAACGFDAFARAADMVQTRAFHMRSDNWLTGASQDAAEELYLIPAMDMLNHASHPADRNTRLDLVRGDVEVGLPGGQSRTFREFFSMKAESDIPAGTQVLHTYGDLADVQLLQTYGFIDAPPSAAAPGGGNPHNYVVVSLRELLAAVTATAAAAKLWPQGKKEAKKVQKLLDAKLSLLASAGLLQRDDPAASQLMLSAAQPLPDALLTIVQVLLMSKDELQQLQEQAAAQQKQQAKAKGRGKRGKAAAGADGGGSSEAGAAAAGADAAVGVLALDLGKELLAGEFGELVATVLLQTVAMCLKRYGRDAAANAAQMGEAAAGSRPWLAAAVALGEQQLLQQLKKGAVQLLMEAKGDDSDDDEDEDDDSGDDGSDDESEEEEEAEPAPKKQKAGGGARQQQAAEQKQQAVAAAAAGDGDGKASSRHKHHKHKKHKQGSSAQQQHKDHRPHYGAMTGPAEQDVWQSDDSSGKVGYSSGSDGASGDDGSAGASDGGGSTAAAAAAPGSGTRRRRERHAAGSGGERHTYDVGPSGVVREAHGHMLGPEEGDLIQSDDSDKVGYGDDDGSSGGGGRGRSSGGSGDAARAAKKQRPGLGFK